MKNSTLFLILLGIAGTVFAMRKKGMIKLPGLWTLPAAGQKYKKDFDYASLIYQIPKNMLARMAQQESSYRPYVISSAGAVGLMQIVPKFHPNVNALDPNASILYAAEYIRNLYNRFGDWKLALAAYNWGPTNLSKKGFSNAPSVTKRYVQQISSDINLA